jgi:hypothetical protein
LAISRGPSVVFLERFFLIFLQFFGDRFSFIRQFFHNLRTFTKFSSVFIPAENRKKIVEGERKDPVKNIRRPKKDRNDRGNTGKGMNELEKIVKRLKLNR